jgi:hypothetical protein
MTAAVLDACVLYSASLRDLFMHLAAGLVFQPKWTNQIHAEWIRSLLEQRPDLERARLERTRELMNRWARDWHVPRYAALIPTLSLPDPKDRHVLAAAIAGQVALIVTFDLSHFPEATLAAHGIRGPSIRMSSQVTCSKRMRRLFSPRSAPIERPSSCRRCHLKSIWLPWRHAACPRQPPSSRSTKAGSNAATTA